MKNRLIEIMLWIVAAVFTITLVCTAMAWVIGIVVFVMRLING